METKMEEMWAKILGFPKYSVSTEGRIRNDVRERIVQQSCTAHGLAKVGLSKNGKQYTRSVKILVATAFIPGKTAEFDTAMNLDGNQQNNHVHNLVWRPHWFVCKYSAQFANIDDYRGIGPIVDRHSGLVYADIVDAGIANGYLFKEIKMALVNKIPVFPTWHLFDWSKQT